MKALNQKEKKAHTSKTTSGPNSKNKISLLLVLVFVLLSFLISFVTYPLLPETMTVHWGINGEANGFAPRVLGIIIMPVLTLFLAALLITIPKLDPLKGNIESFKEKYYEFIAVFCGFMLYIHTITILLNFGLNLNLIALLSPAFALLMYYMGILLGSAKRNYFIGIRTPWTLDSEKVWEKTHKLGEKAYKLSAIICLFGIIFPSQALILILGPIILSSTYLIIFSYLEHKKIVKK